MENGHPKSSRTGKVAPPNCFVTDADASFRATDPGLCNIRGT
jgi:hypothetical protein